MATQTLNLENLPDLLTVREVAQILRVSTLTIKRWGKRGKLTPIRINSRGDRRYKRKPFNGFSALPPKRNNTMSPEGERTRHSIPTPEKPYVVITKAELFSPTCSLWEKRGRARYLSILSLSKVFDTIDSRRPKNPDSRVAVIHARFRTWARESGIALESRRSKEKWAAVYSERDIKRFLQATSQTEIPQTKYRIATGKPTETDDGLSYLELAIAMLHIAQEPSPGFPETASVGEITDIYLREQAATPLLSSRQKKKA